MTGASIAQLVFEVNTLFDWVSYLLNETSSDLKYPGNVSHAKGDLTAQLIYVAANPNCLVWIFFYQNQWSVMPRRHSDNMSQANISLNQGWAKAAKQKIRVWSPCHSSPTY